MAIPGGPGPPCTIRDKQSALSASRMPPGCQFRSTDHVVADHQQGRRSADRAGLQALGVCSSASHDIRTPQTTGRAGIPALTSRGAISLRPTGLVTRPGTTVRLNDTNSWLLHSSVVRNGDHKMQIQLREKKCEYRNRSVNERNTPKKWKSHARSSPLMQDSAARPTATSRFSARSDRFGYSGRHMPHVLNVPLRKSGTPHQYQCCNTPGDDSARIAAHDW
jgi:hypothetical protein